MWCDGALDAFATRHGLTPDQARWLACTAEHLVARCDGGRDTDDNIVAACRRCNAYRHRRVHPRTPEQHRHWARTRVLERRWLAVLVP